jgi:hypothetical protein
LKPLAMTERYSHLSPENSEKTVKTMGKIIKQGSNNNLINKDFGNG